MGGRHLSDGNDEFCKVHGGFRARRIQLLCAAGRGGSGTALHYGANALANADDNHNAAAGNHVPDTQPNAPDDDGAHDRAHAITHTYAIVGPHSGTYSTAHTHAYALANRIADFRTDAQPHARPGCLLCGWELPCR